MGYPQADPESISSVDTTLQELIGITERTKEVPHSILDRYFWLIALIGLLGVPLITLAMAWGLSTLVGERAGISGVSVFELSEVRITGPTELCPGETLNFEFDVYAREVGTYNLWMSTWKVDPPPSTIIFSETEPFVIGSEREFLIKRQWVVPSSYEDKADNTSKDFVVGSYIRDISVTAEGRDTRNNPIQVLFNIRKNCKRP